MAIDGGMRAKLEAGMRLTAKYKGEQHTAELVAGEDGKLLFRLADGRDFKSPSAAGSAVMSGQACNGWRFWSLEAEEPSKQQAKSRRKATTNKAADEAPAAEEPVTSEPFVEA